MTNEPFKATGMSAKGEMPHEQRHAPLSREAAERAHGISGREIEEALRPIVPRLGDSDADIEVVARIIADHTCVHDIGSDILIDGIHDAARAIIELIRQNRGIAHD